MAENPFGEATHGRPVNPFGDDDDPHADPIRRVEQSAAQIRNLRSLVGAEGLAGAGTRQLLDELSATMSAVARALRKLQER